MYGEPSWGRMHGWHRQNLAILKSGGIVEGREEGVDVDSFVEADMPESNPVLSQSVGRDHDELALDIFVCSYQPSIKID